MQLQRQVQCKGVSFIFALFSSTKCTKSRLAAGLSRDLLGALERSPNPVAVAGNIGRDGERAREEKGGKGGQEEKGNLRTHKSYQKSAPVQKN